MLYFIKCIKNTCSGSQYFKLQYYIEYLENNYTEVFKKNTIKQSLWENKKK